MKKARSVALVVGASVLALGCATQAEPPLAPAADSVAIRAGSLPLVRTMDERFQSFQLGMSHLTGGDTWVSYENIPKEGGGAQAGERNVREPRAPADLSNTRLRTLVKALGPFYVRYGGTTTNSVYFQDNDEPQLAKAPAGFKVVLTRARWKEAIDFAKAVDAKVFTGFAVSSGVRDGLGVWTPRTALPWVQYTRSIGGEIYGAELYNEPNAPDPAPGMADDYGSAANLARDFAILRSAVKKVAPNLKLAGPGDARFGPPGAGPGSVLDRVTTEQYFTATPRPQYDIVSYHYYPGIAERCAPPESAIGVSPAKALTEEWLARQDREFQSHKALRDRFAPGAPIWNTETGAAGCGGTKWQPTFLDTFRFIDTEARLAKQGLDAMFTHALISGSNGVIDEKTFLPNASYWAAVVWRKTVGTQVLDAGPQRPGLHLYAHCLRGSRGGVTVIAINLQPTAASLDVGSSADVYALTSPELQSRTVLLNGRPLALGPGDTFPAIAPVRVNGSRVPVAGHSVNFVTLPQAHNPRCTSAL